MINMDDIKLLDYLNNELSEKERQEVEEWLNLRDENRFRLQRLNDDVHLARWGVRQQLVKGSYYQVYKRIKIRKLFRYSTRYAAIFFIIISCAVFLKYYMEKSDTVILSSVSPGSSRAFLELSSGEIIDIADNFCQLKEEDGTSINVTSSGSLTYLQSDSHDLSKDELYNKLVVPRGGEFSVVLEDGTEVFLNSGSEFRYPTNFKSENREVFLKGEAYFNVKKNKSLPFIVHVDKCMVKVFGTEFNINTHKKNCIQTVLVSGKISFSEQDNEITMEPGEKVEYNIKEGKVTKEKVDVNRYIAWKYGLFIFENETLEDIMNTLSLWYDINVDYSDPKARTVRLTGEMERFDTIDNILYFFEKISNVKFVKSGKKITVKI